LDRLLLHQLAEATVRALLSQLVTALLVPVPDVVEPAPRIVEQHHGKEPDPQPEQDRPASPS
jgi:hypothetical protein